MSRSWTLTLLLGLGLNAMEPRSADRSWPLLLACVGDPVPEASGDDRANTRAWERVWECGRAGRDIVSLGQDADRERLWSVFDELPESSLLRSYVLSAFLDWHLSRAFEGFGSVPLGSATVPGVAASDLPEHLQAAPPELQAAWRVYDGVMRDRNKARPDLPEGKGIAFQSNEPAFQRTVASFLRGRTAPADAVQELTRFEWGGWCGTGSDALYEPQSKALLLAYLDLGRRDLAAAISGGLGGGLFTGEPSLAWDARLLSAAGIDWERFHLGGVVAGMTGLADALARHGSDDSARHLLAATRFLHERNPAADGSMVDPEDLLWPLAALVESNGGCAGYGTGNSREVERDPGAPALSAMVQEGALELLAASVRPEAGLEEANAASHLLVQRCRPESRGAFRNMLRSPYSEVRHRGALGLRGLGETVGEPVASRPVSFRVLVDGKPLPRQQVEWTLASGENGSQSSGATTDGEGVLHMARDSFVDSRRPVTAVVLSLPTLKSPADPWFELRLVRPRHLDQTTMATVRTGSLTVVAPARTTLTLMAETMRYGSIPYAQAISAELPIVNGRVTFPRLQQGHYSVQVAPSHGATDPVLAVEVGDRPVTVTIPEP